MKNIAKKTVVSTKNFVVAHKGAVALVTIAVMQAAALRRHDDFLKEHQLFNEFHNINS